jgi:uncharacterized protein YuzE
MAEPIINHWDPDPLEDPATEYFPDTGTLYVDNGKPFGEGETIARNLVVFYDRENENEVVGMMIDHAETVLKPFVDAILAKHGVSRELT